VFVVLWAVSIKCRKVSMLSRRVNLSMSAQWRYSRGWSDWRRDGERQDDFAKKIHVVTYNFVQFWNRCLILWSIEGIRKSEYNSKCSLRINDDFDGIVDGLDSLANLRKYHNIYMQYSRWITRCIHRVLRTCWWLWPRASVIKCYVFHWFFLRADKRSRCSVT